MRMLAASRMRRTSLRLSRVASGTTTTPFGSSRSKTSCSNALRWRPPPPSSTRLGCSRPAGISTGSSPCKRSMALASSTAAGQTPSRSALALIRAAPPARCSTAMSWSSGRKRKASSPMLPVPAPKSQSTPCSGGLRSASSWIRTSRFVISPGWSLCCKYTPSSRPKRGRVFGSCCAGSFAISKAINSRCKSTGRSSSGAIC